MQNTGTSYLCPVDVFQSNKTEKIIKITIERWIVNQNKTQFFALTFLIEGDLHWSIN